MDSTKPWYPFLIILPISSFPSSSNRSPPTPSTTSLLLSAATTPLTTASYSQTKSSSVNNTFTTSPTTIVLGGLTLYLSAKSAIFSIVPTTVRCSGHPARSTIPTGVVGG